MHDQLSDSLLDAGRHYEELFVPTLFSPWAERLIDQAALKEGASILDLACGTGVVARRAQPLTGPGSDVVGVDPAPGMLATASRIAPQIAWVSGEAESLDFADKRFDRVLCQFGLMFFNDRQRALDETFRVLQPAGRMVLSVWDHLGANPAHAAIVDLLDNKIGTAAADALRLPYCLGDAHQVTRLLKQAGYTSTEVHTTTLTAHFPSLIALIEADLRGWLPLFDIILTDTQIDAVLNAADEHLQEFVTDSGGAALPTSAHIIIAGKP